MTGDRLKPKSTNRNKVQESSVFLKHLGWSKPGDQSNEGQAAETEVNENELQVRKWENEVISRAGGSVRTIRVICNENRMDE